MSYTVLARRYRSRDFDEVVGQEPIARTLRNAISSGRVAHAYLFCGTRGVGKTTMARLFARALNVTDELSEAEAIADAVMRGEDLDVIEIDGASNRGVQEARDLIASAGLKPARCPYRIYIIDEVHMLTRDAFNALLKTMEEPPEHVKFILCTTEPNDVLQTIQSRCQRFDFRAIPARQIADHLSVILDQEGIASDPEALLQVARLGEGSMRDALSILDRLLAAGPDRLTAEVVSSMLGLPAQARIEAAIDATLSGDAAEALQVGETLLQEGVTIEQAIESMIESFRALLLAVTCGIDTELLHVSDEQRERIGQRCGGLDADAVLHMIARCEATARHARFTASARALFDALLVRLAATERLADIPEMLRGATPAASKKKTTSHRPPEVITPEPVVAPVAAVRSEPPRPSAPANESQAEVRPTAVAAPETDSPPVDMDELWNAMLEGASSNAERALLDIVKPVAWEAQVLHLEPEDVSTGRGSYLQSQIPVISGMVQGIAGRTCRAVLRIPEAPARSVSVDHEVTDHPDVKNVMELFDAVVVGVES
ncbi:MAG: DNA polymerase III subunit gamma/tau, partial [Phycisphaerales bacterium]|nr:DNA polymerase III subunit gamma/tau [Phycisphaerales bacterium]